MNPRSGFRVMISMTPRRFPWIDRAFAVFPRNAAKLEHEYGIPRRLFGTARSPKIFFLITLLVTGGVHAALAGEEAGSASAPNIDLASLPEVTFRSVNTRETLAVKPYASDGSVDTALVQAFAHFFRDSRRNHEHAVDPRLVQLLYKVALHFKTREIEIISGYRRVPHWSESRHGKGQAADFRIPGVVSGDVAAYSRSLGKVGVGWYPRVDFVHLDVRDSSYYWINRSKRGRYGWNRPLVRKGGLVLDRSWTPEWDWPGFEPEFKKPELKEAVDAVRMIRTDLELSRIQKEKAERRRHRRLQREKKGSDGSDRSDRSSNGGT